MKNIEHLSFSFLMDLYRIKEKAIKRNDQSAIDSLKNTYADLFSDEFEEFIVYTLEVKDRHYNAKHLVA
jgi:hypothetical protein